MEGLALPPPRGDLQNEAPFDRSTYFLGLGKQKSEDKTEVV